MKDIALYKTIYLQETNGIHLQEYIVSGKSSEIFKLDLIDFDIPQYSKYIDGDLLSLQFSPKELDGLCSAWLSYRHNAQEADRD